MSEHTLTPVEAVKIARAFEKLGQAQRAMLQADASCKALVETAAQRLALELDDWRLNLDEARFVRRNGENDGQ